MIKSEIIYERGRFTMSNIIDNLYNLIIFFTVGCMITTLVTGYYIVKMIKCDKKEKLLNKELEKIQVKNAIIKQSFK